MQPAGRGGPARRLPSVFWAEYKLADQAHQRAGRGHRGKVSLSRS